MPRPPVVVGAVLAGGASRRMGTDKALVAVDGVPMARRVADALLAGGASAVVLVGGDPSWSETLGLVVVPDRWPGEGPLGGIAGALLDVPAAAGTAPVDPAGDPEGRQPTGEVIVVIAPCDVPWLDAATVAALVRALVDRPTAVVATAVDGDGRRLPFPAAWRAGAGAAVAELVAEGERRADAGFTRAGEGGVIDVAVDACRVRDVDGPGDLAIGS